MNKLRGITAIYVADSSTSTILRSPRCLYTPLPFAFPYAPIFWAVMIWALSPEFKIVRTAQQSVRSDDSHDAGSFRVIIIGMWFALMAAFPLGWVQGLGFPKTWSVAVFVLGLIVLTGGSLLRRHCWRMLGESFTGDVQARRTAYRDLGCL